MQIHRDLGHLPPFKKAVVTIGTFDGVHLGHRQIIAQLKEEAREIDGETVIITFHPHPRSVIGTHQHALRLINTIEEKIGLLAATGIDHLVIVPFTTAFSKLTAAEYIEHFLVEKFHPHTVIIGYDHRFGQGRKGDYHLLEAYSALLGFRLKEIPPHVIHENTVSSTRIREAIGRGEMAVAHELLGYYFFFEGRIVEGDKLGRTLGYPTANLEPENPEKLVPGHGVYAVEALLRDEEQAANRLKGMMNIGLRPTVNGTRRMIEVHLFDFNAPVYGRILRVWVVRHLRAEQKFSGLEALKAQLGKDEIAARKVLDH